MKRCLFICILLIASAFCRAQLLDSLKVLTGYRSTIDARLESRISFVNHQVISVSGVRLGVVFRRKLRMGGGVSWLKTQIKTTVLNELNEPEEQYLKFAYLCYYMDFVFYKYNRWQLSVPIQMGTGLSWTHPNSNYSFGNRGPKYFLFLYEPGITVQFKIFKWVGVGADVAYRFALQNNEKIGQHLNSSTYSFKILFWPDQLFFDVFPQSELSKKYGPAVW